MKPVNTEFIHAWTLVASHPVLFTSRYLHLLTLGVLAAGMELPSSLENCPQLKRSFLMGKLWSVINRFGGTKAAPHIKGGRLCGTTRAPELPIGSGWSQSTAGFTSSLSSYTSNPSSSFPVFLTPLLPLTLINKSLVQKSSSQALLLRISGDIWGTRIGPQKGPSEG